MVTPWACGASRSKVRVSSSSSDTNTASTQAPDALGGGKMLVGFAPGTLLTNVLTPPESQAGMVPAMLPVAADGTVVVTLPPRGQAVLVAASEAAGIDALPLSKVMPARTPPAGAANTDMGN